MPPGAGQRIPLWLWAALAACLALRGLAAEVRLLGKDEAVYWTWSRDPQLSYMDHPPVTAWMIAAGTELLGHHELAVRLLTLAAGAVTMVCLLALGARLLTTHAALRWLGLILMLSPLLMATGILALPDGPVMMFGALGLACAVAAVRSPAGSAPARWWWLAFGACTGAGLLSKYTAVTLPVAVLAALLTSADGRRHLARLSTWLVVLLPAAAVFSPAVIWNAQHEWASFRFQLGQGLGASEGDDSSRWWVYVRHIVEFIGGQMLLWTPVLWLIGLAALVWGWRVLRQLDTAWRVLLLNATVPLALFFVAAIRSGGEPNWPGFAYLPLALLTVKFLESAPAGLAHRLLPAALVVSAVGMLFLLLPEVVFPVARLAGAPLPGKLDETYGWRELAGRVDALRREEPGGYRTLVAATMASEAGLLSFYLPDRPRVTVISFGERRYAQDYFASRPDYSREQRVLLVGYPPAGQPDDAVERAVGFPPGTPRQVSVALPSGTVRQRRVTIAERGTPSP